MHFFFFCFFTQAVAGSILSKHSSMKGVKPVSGSFYSVDTLVPNKIFFVDYVTNETPVQWLYVSTKFLLYKKYVGILLISRNKL